MPAWLLTVVPSALCLGSVCFVQVHVEVENQGSELVAGMAILGSKNRHRCVKLVTGIDTSSFYSMCMRCLD